MQQKITSFLFKCSIFLMLGACFSGSSFAQTLLSSGFEDAKPPAPPAGWTVTHTGKNKWQSLDGTGGGNQLAGKICMFVQNGGDGSLSDAWLITTPVFFEAGKKYSISFYYKNQVFQSNRLQVTLGDNTSPSSQTEIIWEKGFKDDFYAKAQINYTAVETGTKYIGIHCNTPVTYTYVYIDNFQVSSVKCFEPTGLKISNQTTSSAIARWDVTENAPLYEFGVNNEMKPPARTLFTKDKYTSLAPLQPATHYYFYVRTVYSPGQSSDWAVVDFSSSYDTAGIETINCGKPFSNVFRANEGLYKEEYCGDIYFSKEFFHRFIPTETGMYNLNIYSVNTGQYMTFLYKDAALGAGADGWTCIGGANDFGGKFTFGPLEKGKEYLIMEKAKASPGLPSSYAYGIDCYAPPPANDNCDNATAMDVTVYNDSCRATRFTTLGASATPLKEGSAACGYGVADDDIWVKFTASSNMELFRLRGMIYHNTSDRHANPGIYFNIYSNPCDLKSLVDCGYVPVSSRETKDIISYKLQKDQTYYCRIFTADQFTFASFGLCIMNVPVTNGIANECLQGLPYSIDKYTDRNNLRSWVPLLDNSNLSYRLISAVNARGNTLNFTTGSVYINAGALRKDANNTYYLDRNIHITADQQPASSIGVRIVVSNSELNKLIAQPGSGVSSIKDIRVTQNLDNCSPVFTSPSIAFITPYRSGDYDAHHKFIEFEVNSLSSFYLHGGSVPLTGNSTIAAMSSDAAQSGTLQKLSVYPNPFTDKFTIVTNEQVPCKYSISLSDMNGRIVRAFDKIAGKGYNQFTIEAGNLTAGIYTLKLEKEGSVQYRKMVKE